MLHAATPGGCGRIFFTLLPSSVIVCLHVLSLLPSFFACTCVITVAFVLHVANTCRLTRPYIACSSSWCRSCMQRQASRVACPARAYAATLHARRGDSGAKYAAERRILRVVGYYLYVSPSYGCVSNNAHIRSYTHMAAYSLSFPYPYESVPTRGGRREKTRMVGSSMASVKKRRRARIPRPLLLLLPLRLMLLLQRCW
jgi:hypothetical protein